MLQAIAGETRAHNASEEKGIVRITHTEAFRPVYFDFEKHNPRVQAAFDMVKGIDVTTQIRGMFSSHGETVRSFFKSIETLPHQALLLLDEPDAALSPRSAYKLANALKASKVMQSLVAVHNPILIESQPEVFSMEHRRWMSSQEFMKLQKI